MLLTLRDKSGCFVTHIAVNKMLDVLMLKHELTSVLADLRELSLA